MIYYMYRLPRLSNKQNILRLTAKRIYQRGTSLKPYKSSYNIKLKKDLYPSANDIKKDPNIIHFATTKSLTHAVNLSISTLLLNS
jgi:hypothetical protein